MAIILLTVKVRYNSMSPRRYSFFFFYFIKQQKETGTNFTVLSQPRYTIGGFMKTYLHKPIKIIKCLTRGRIQRCLKRL